MFVRVRTPDWREDKLQNTVKRAEAAAEKSGHGVFVVPGELFQPGDERADETVHPVLLEIVIEHRGEEREKNGKADHVDEHGQKHDEQGRLLHWQKE